MNRLTDDKDKKDEENGEVCSAKSIVGEGERLTSGLITGVFGSKLTEELTTETRT